MEPTLFRCIVLIALMQYPLFSGGQSLSFPAGLSGNRMDIGDLDISGNTITIEALITIRSADYKLMDIVCKHLDPADLNYLLRASRFMIRTSKGMADLVNPIVFCPNATYHVAGTYDGSRVRYFVNGIEVASKPWSGNLQLNNDITAIGNMWNQAGTYNEQFSGYIDEVRIWKVARSQQAIAANMYDLPNPRNQTGLLAYYKFEGNAVNLQGNEAWNGKANRRQVTLDTNPYFTGTVSEKFCGNAGVYLTAAKASEPPPKPILAVKVEPIPVSVPPVNKPMPVVAKPSPSSISCNTINWASWDSFSGSDARGTVKYQGSSVAITLNSNFRFTSSPDIWNYREFKNYPSAIPNNTVPAIEWSNKVVGTVNMCFSKPVTDPVLMIGSLGSFKNGTPVNLKFSVPFEVVYTAGRMMYESNTSMTGREGYAVIRFKGTISCVEVKASAFEHYANLTWGLPDCKDIVKLPPVPAVVKQAPPPKPPKPELKAAPQVIKKPAPLVIEKETTKSIVSLNLLKVQIWDFDCMDFDSVSLKFNGKPIGPPAILLPLYRREAPAFTYSMDLQPGDNTLEIYAISEGANPLTSVGLLIMYDDRRKKVYYKIKAGETTRIHL